MKRAALMALILMGCSAEPPGNETAASEQLESLAIARGVIPDPATASLAGLYARESDRICVVDAADSMRIGLYAEFGDGLSCSGSGSVQRRGELLSVRLDSRGSCAFEARFDGDRITVPGALPPGCAAYCAPRASLAGMNAIRVGDASAIAELRGRDGAPLCD